MTIKANKHRSKHYPYANKKWYRTRANRDLRRILKQDPDLFITKGRDFIKAIFDVRWNIW